MKIKIGTRSSKLAMWQTYQVRDILEADGIEVEIVQFETKGDKVLDKSISKIGSKGVFTEELEESLRTGELDIAVHSAKDLQSSLADDLQIIAFMEREQENDVLVSLNKKIDLSTDIVIGTSSMRRRALLAHYYPHYKVVDMRGNLQTRMRKMEEGQCDALLLAYAGVHRMGYDDFIIHQFSKEEFVPPVGQGSVAIECHTGLAQDKKDKLRSLLNHEDTEICLKAERSFLRTLEGGCSIPVYGYANLIEGGNVYMRVGLVAPDGSRMLRENQTVKVGDSEELGEVLGRKILKMGGDQILKELKNN